MINTVITKITEVCRSNGKTDSFRTQMLGLIFQQIDEALSDRRRELGRDLSVDETDSVITTSLTSRTLTNTIHIVEGQLESEAKQRYKPLQRKNSIKQYLIDLSSNVVGTLIYSLILLLIFSLAKDQIRSWLNSLDTTTKQEQVIDPSK